MYHFDIWRPVTIAGVAVPAQKGVKNREAVSVAPPAAQANIFDEGVDAPGPGPHLVSGKPTELQQKLEDIKSRFGGLGALPRVPGRRARSHRDEPFSRRQHRGLADLLPRVGSKTDGGSQSADRGSSTDLLPGVVESQSDCMSRGGGGARRHDGADDDDFFEPELFHEASPRACSHLLVRSRRMQGRLLAEALSSMRCFLGVPGGGGNFRPAANLGLPGNTVLGLRTSREMRTIAESIDALMEGDILRAGDLLIQRFKALETSVIDGTWSRAPHHELNPEEGVGLASAAERQAISRLELQRRKLTKTASKKLGVDSAAPPGQNLEERRQVKAPRSIPPGGARAQPEKAKIGVLMEKRKEWRQAAAVDRKLESGLGGEEAAKTQAGKVFLKPGPGKRPWKKKLVSVARRLP